MLVDTARRPRASDRLGTTSDPKGNLVSEAERHGFPLFEVPYEMPFIAITEKAFARLVNEQYDVLARGISLHESLERLVLEERGLPEILGAVAGAIGGEGPSWTAVGR